MGLTSHTEEWYMKPMSDKCVPSWEMLKEIKRQHPRVLLSFSMGKDSIAAYISMREHWAAEDIVPFYLYLVPGLEFVERELEWYETHMFDGVHIERVPNPNLYGMLNDLVYQPPERIQIIEELRLPTLSYEELRAEMCADYDLPPDTFYGAGVRASDSPTRWSAIKNYGPITVSKKKFYPIWDWRIRTVIERIKEEGLRLPEDYAVFGRSFDGIDLRFLLPIKKRWPDDYARILEWFPLVELEIKRYEYSLKK